MSFLSPLMLWGSLAAGIPIALHFFFRSRYRTVPWGAMKFLLESIEQTSRRLRFQELLLLVVRCLLLIVLALAFARPISSASRGSGRGDAVDAVFLFDVSYSMTARDGAGTRFDRAQAAALKVLEELPPHSTVQIVTCADRAAVLGPQTPGNLDQAAAIIKNLRLTSLATDLAPGVVEAASILQRGQAANKELYLFSDLQRSGWQRQSGLLVQTFNEIKEKAAVTLVRCGAGPVKNLSVVGIVPQERAAAPEQRLGFAVLVRNTGTIPVDDAVVSLTVDGDDKTTETTALSSVAPGETRVAALTAKLGKAGLAVLTARLRGDELDGDNRFDQVLKVHDHIDILVVDGGMENRASLVDALHSDLARQRVQPSVVTPRLAAPALLDKKDIVILANVALAADPRRLAEVPPADFLEALAAYVRQGRSLVIFAGDNVDPDAYNRVLGKQLGLLPLPLAGREQRAAKDPLVVNRSSAQLPAFAEFKDDDHYRAFGMFYVWKTLVFAEPEAPDEPNDAAAPAARRDAPVVVFRYSNGKPAVVARKVDAGEVVVIGTAAEMGRKPSSGDPDWTDWQKEGHYGFVPFVQVLMGYLLQRQSQPLNLVAGEALRWHPSERQQRSFTLVHPDGTSVRLGQPTTVSGRPVVVAQDLLTAGIYRLRALLPAEATAPTDAGAIDKAAVLPLAVVPDLQESDDLTSLSNDEIDERLGFRPRHVLASAETTASVLADHLNREWTTWVLLAVLLLVVGEGVLAWWCGRAW